MVDCFTVIAIVALVDATFSIVSAVYLREMLEKMLPGDGVDESNMVSLINCHFSNIVDLEIVKARIMVLMAVTVQ